MPCAAQRSARVAPRRAALRPTISQRAGRAANEGEVPFAVQLHAPFPRDLFVSCVPIRAPTFVFFPLSSLLFFIFFLYLLVSRLSLFSRWVSRVHFTSRRRDVVISKAEL